MATKPEKDMKDGPAKEARDWALATREWLAVATAAVSLVILIRSLRA
jgi:hypothetical protein